MKKAKGTILIVEDDFHIRSQLIEVFEGEEYPVRSAENGRVALSLLEDLSPLPRLIFLDLMMPVMDGQTFLTEIQRRQEKVRFKDIPVAIVSAARQEIYGNVVAYFRKPPQIDQLLDLAERYATFD